MLRRLGKPKYWPASLAKGMSKQRLSKCLQGRTSKSLEILRKGVVIYHCANLVPDTGHPASSTDE